MLRAQLTDLRKTEREIFGTKTTTNEQRILAAAVAGAERNAKHWDECVAAAKAGKFGEVQRVQAPSKLTSPALEALRAQAKASRAVYDELESLANPREDARAEEERKRRSFV